MAENPCQDSSDLSQRLFPLRMVSFSLVEKTLLRWGDGGTPWNTLGSTEAEKVELKKIGHKIQNQSFD